MKYLAQGGVVVNTAVKKLARGRPKKKIKYTKTINVRFTHEQWLGIQVLAHKSHLEPSVFIRKTILEQFGVVPERMPESSFKALKIEPLESVVRIASRPKSKQPRKAFSRTGHGQLHFDM